MGLFGLFGKKKDKSSGEDTGGLGSSMVGMMKMMGDMSDAERKPMVKGRLGQLMELPEEKRQESIREMVGAFHSPDIKDAAREKLIATRTEIIGELPEEKRRMMMASRMQALKDLPDLNQADMAVTKKVLPQVPEGTRKAFMESMDAMMNNPPQA